MEKEQFALEALKLFPDDVRLVYHHFPDTESEISMMLAESLEIAGEQDKFWEMHDQLIENVPEDMEVIEDVAKKVGLNMDIFSELIKDGTYADVVLDAIEEAKEHGVESISLFVNETRHKYYPGTLDDLVNMINSELDKAANG